MIQVRNEVLRAGRVRWSARRHGQPLRRGRRQDAPDRHEGRGLDGVDRSSDEGQHAHRGSAQPADEAMVLVVKRAGMVMVVGVGARLIHRMGEDQPAGLTRGALLAGAWTVLEKLVELVESRRRDQGEIQDRERSRSASRPNRPGGLKPSTTHATAHAAKAASEPLPIPLLPPSRGSRRALPRIRRRSAHRLSRMRSTRK
jgi:hypothetical protein